MDVQVVRREQLGTKAKLEAEHQERLAFAKAQKAALGEIDLEQFCKPKKGKKKGKNAKGKNAKAKKASQAADDGLWEGLDFDFPYEEVEPKAKKVRRKVSATAPDDLEDGAPSSARSKVLEPASSNVAKPKAKSSKKPLGSDAKPATKKVQKALDSDATPDPPKKRKGSDAKQADKKGTKSLDSNAKPADKKGTKSLDSHAKPADKRAKKASHSVFSDSSAELDDPGFEAKHGPPSKKQRVSEGKQRPATFARRYRPEKEGFARAKWQALRSVFYASIFERVDNPSKHEDYIALKIGSVRDYYMFVMGFMLFGIPTSLVYGRILLHVWRSYLY